MLKELEMLCTSSKRSSTTGQPMSNFWLIAFFKSWKISFFIIYNKLGLRLLRQSLVLSKCWAVLWNFYLNNDWRPTKAKFSMGKLYIYKEWNAKKDMQKSLSKMRISLLMTILKSFSFAKDFNSFDLYFQINGPLNDTRLSIKTSAVG